MITYEKLATYSMKTGISDGIPKRYAAGDDGKPLSVSEAEREMVERVHEFLRDYPNHNLTFAQAVEHLAKRDPLFRALMATYNGRQISKAYGARPPAVDYDEGIDDPSAELLEAARLDAVRHNYTLREAIEHVLSENEHLRVAYANYTTTPRD